VILKKLSTNETTNIIFQAQASRLPPLTLPPPLVLSENIISGTSLLLNSCQPVGSNSDLASDIPLERSLFAYSDPLSPADLIQSSSFNSLLLAVKDSSKHTDDNIDINLLGDE